MSESEPELGLGTIGQTGGGRVQVEFTAAGETRTYAVDQAPLKRVRFRAGDRIRTRADKEFIVQEVVEQSGLLIYVGEKQQLTEAELSDRVSLQGPQERLFAGRFDTSREFELRRRTLELLHRVRKSPVRGTSPRNRRGRLTFPWRTLPDRAFPCKAKRPLGDQFREAFLML